MGKFSYYYKLSDRLENNIETNAMVRFIYNLWSDMYPNRITLRDISEKLIFWTGPHIKKKV